MIPLVRSLDRQKKNQYCLKPSQNPSTSGLKIAALALALTGAGLVTTGCKDAPVTPQAPETSEVNAATAHNGLIDKTISALDKLFGLNKWLDPYHSDSHSQKTKEAIDPSRFQLSARSFPKTEIAKYQRAGTAATGTPSELQGIWWMDGNPLADETVSFADMDFKAERIFLSTFAPNNFSFHSGKGPGDEEYKKGTELWQKGIAGRVVYEFEFEGGKNTDYKKAVIYPIVTFETGKILGFDLPLKVPKQFLKFTLEYVNDDYYRRNNYFFGRQPQEKEKAGYDLKRILKPDPSQPGKLVPTIHWNEYITYKGGPAYLRFAEVKTQN